MSAVRWGLALALFVTTLAVLVSTARELGYSRDEGFYFHAASVYEKWFDDVGVNRARALERTRVDETFSVNHEHPALMKGLFALSHRELHVRHAVFSEPGTSYRFPGMVVSALLVTAVFLWASARRGVAVGLASAGVLFLAPRFFYHAHLACFDAPIAALFFFTCMAYARSLETEGPLWPVLTGVLFGLALDTKHNSWFLPFVVVAHAALLGLTTLRTRRGLVATLRRPLQVLAAMGLVGPMVCYALWPWIWHDTVARLREYARFHLEHEYYNMEFLGSNYFEPPMPRLYAPIMTLATVPMATLLAAGVGVLFALRSLVRDLRARDREVVETHGDAALWAIAVLVSYAPWLRDSTPIFGGTKHWMTAYPFLALFAGEGIHQVSIRLKTELELRGLARAAASLRAVVAGLVLAPSLEQAWDAHPWGLSAYSPVVGGASGAASLGLNRGFWGYTTGALVDYLNRTVPEDGAVYPHDTGLVAWETLKEDGRLRRDIRAVWSIDAADIVLYHHEMHMQGQEYQAWVVCGTTRPDVVRGLDGVPVVWAYRCSKNVRTANREAR
ncbi:MAG: glycosyltransferase family 39 protein [Polyangiaceae bacterium]